VGEKVERDVALDRFRGIAVILMALGDNIANVDVFPSFLKHAPDIGFTVADIVAPVFIFAIAMTYKPSFLRRFDKSKPGVYTHFLSKYLALIGLGTIFSAGGVVVAKETAWGVLQAIGIAGLITLIFIRLPSWIRILAAVGILIGYQFILDHYMLDAVLGSIHGGFVGSLSWGAMLLLSTAMADYFVKNKKWFLAGLGLLALISVGSLFIVPISKNRVSLSYVLVSVTICCAFYYIVDTISCHIEQRPGLVAYWGENPLLLYILHLIIMGIIKIPLALMHMDSMPLIYGIFTDIIIFASLSYIALKIHSKNVLIKL
jgi:predicted acyltransferase